MGNKIAKTTQVSASEYYLHDLPSSYNLVFIEPLGHDRLFKSIRCKHDEGEVLVKVYFKRGDPVVLKEYERRLSEIREIFRRVRHPHVWPFQFWLETDKAAYLLRQYFFSNLHDRLSTRPFLSLIEKKWLAFQLLCAVKQSHENDVCHGDIKCENVLVTSWNWLYLADFASFKPTYIPIDDPSDFSFFFHTGGRRRCYLAPERFYEQGGETQAAADAPLKPSMDIFSLGCVIAELFLEGQPLFEYSQLLAYRRGQYDPCQLLEKIPDIGIRKMILHMIQLDPEQRLSCESYLQEYGSFVFPSYFSPFLHKFFSCLIPMDSDTRVAVTQSAFHEIHRQMMGSRSFVEIATKCGSDSGVSSCEPGKQMVRKRENMNSSNSYSRNREMGMEAINDQLVGKVSHLLKEVEQGKDHLNVNAMLQDVSYDLSNIGVSQNMEQSRPQPLSEVVQVHAITKEYREKEFPLLRKILKNDLKVLLFEYNGQLDAYTYALYPETRTTLSCEGMVLIASLLCSCIRSVKQPQLRRGAVLLLLHSSLYIDDDDRLQHVLPYVIAMLSDSSAIVRCAALETLSDILPLVRDFPPSDAKIFPEYILPMLSMLPHDQEESVRICYANTIFKIALTAYRLLICAQGSSELRSLDKLNLPPRSPVHSDATLKKHRDGTDAQISQLRKSIAEVIQELVMGPKQTPNIRRALLKDIGHLCYFFGQRQSNDFLLPILPAFLNDRDEQLRAVFYGQIVFVCFFVGQRSVEEYLLPYIEQGLSDGMEAVIVNVLQCLTLLCKSGFLRKRILLDMIGKAFPLLCYPIQWVRRSAVSFIAASSESLGPVDSYVYLSPVLRPFLHRELTSLYLESSLFSCLKPPVSKLVFYQVLESARSSDMLERQRKIWYNSSPSSKQWENIENTNKPGSDLASRSKESNVQDNKDKKYSNIATKLATPDLGDIPKSRVTGVSPRNFSSTMDNRDSLSSEKLQFSGFVSPHVSAGNSLLCDGPSEGIPVYSRSMVRRAALPVANSDTALQWNSSGSGSLSTPWMDPANKSFGLSSSVPPKLVSGSFLNISNGSKQVVKLPQEPEERENDQSAYITSKFQDITVSDALKGTSSMAGEDIPTQFDATGLSPFARSTSGPDAGWRPRGVLVAHLQEHHSAVNDIAASNDHSFFVTASDDSTVKIWDTRKLEKDISFRSRLTYPLDGHRALCTTMICGSAQVVVGAGSGMIHIFSVDYVSRGLGSVVERYSGIADIKKKDDGEGAVLSLLNCSTYDSSLTQTVLYSTQHYGIHLWDTRTDSTTWTFKTPPNEGYISSLVMGSCGNWFVSGSSRGVLTLWDLRFRLPVSSWQYSMECPIEDMCLFIPPANTTMSVSGRPLVYAAAGCDEVSLWNAENGSCHQVLRLAGGDDDAEILSDVPWALRKSSSKSGLKQDRERSGDLKYKIDELNQPPARLPGVRSLLPLPGGDLLTGGTDLKIRYWDNLSPSRSYCICGPSAKGIGCDEQYETRACFGVQVVQETNKRPVAVKLTQKALLAVAATDSGGCHRDSVLSMATVKLNQRLLLSGSRDGAIKVWK